LVVVGAGILRQRDVAQVLPDVFGVSVTGTTTAGIPASKGTPTSLPPQVLSEGMRTYKNRYHGFELVYPAELQVQEYAEDDGSRTILFESATLETGFQIYITSYGGTNVTREQFLKDQPSGVYDQPTDIWVDGVPAIMFFGENSLMGETREVWFIHNGFLYEVTTYKPLDTWLGAIMQSWKFL
jgi:hypothetical protein